jgi:Rrf2 family protein
VSSKRGPAGGHTLAKPPDAISLRDAFDVLEGGTAPWWCVETAEPDCIYAAGCNLRPVWQAINGAMTQVLGGITLADLSRTAQPAGASSGPPVPGSA